MVSMMGTPIQETQGLWSLNNDVSPREQSARARGGWSSNIGIQHFTNMRI
jgi:hypothetical protein